VARAVSGAKTQLKGRVPVQDLGALLKFGRRLQHRAQRLLRRREALALPHARQHQIGVALVEQADAVPEVGIIEGAEVEGGLVVGVVALAQAVERHVEILGSLREGEVAVADRSIHLPRGSVDDHDTIEVVDRVLETLLHAADARELQQRVHISAVCEEHVVVGVGRFCQVVALLRKSGHLQPSDLVGARELVAIRLLLSDIRALQHALRLRRRALSPLREHRLTLEYDQLALRRISG